MLTGFMRTRARGAVQETKTGHKESCGRNEGKAVEVAMKSSSRNLPGGRGAHTHTQKVRRDVKPGLPACGRGYL